MPTISPILGKAYVPTLQEVLGLPELLDPPMDTNSSNVPPPQLAVHRHGLVYQPVLHVIERKYANGEVDFFNGMTTENGQPWSSDWLMHNSATLPLQEPFKIDLIPPADEINDEGAREENYYRHLVIEERKSSLQPSTSRKL
jgi:hypothetical protein